MKELKTIIPANPKVRTLLSFANSTDGLLKWSSFLTRQPVDEGLLIYNNLTLELILVPAEQVPALETPTEELRDWLRRHWLLVPADLDEHRVALELREAFRAMDPPSDKLEKYTVFTTTACNAQCFYCFERGWEPRTMSPETADRAADFMLAHSAGIPFQIDWFGGEPLVNLRAIDQITKKLTEAGADFQSAMVSNGFLFDPEVIARAASLWRLRLVHITLDGIGETYDRIKSYKTGGAGAFERVVENIRCLCEAGIRVNIRMNYDLHNYEEIDRLTDWIIEHLADLPQLRACPAALYEDPDDPEAQRSPEHRELLCQKEIRLRAKLEAAGLFNPRLLPRTVETHMCMADSGCMITILPGGEFGLCESYDRDGFIGSLDDPILNEAVMAEMRELRPEIPECADCPLYPGCIRLRKCPNQICHAQRRFARIERRKRSMLLEWNRYKNTKTGGAKHE